MGERLYADVASAHETSRAVVERTWTERLYGLSNDGWGHAHAVFGEPYSLGHHPDLVLV